MFNLFVKMYKRYGFLHCVKNFFKYLEAFRQLELMAEKFSATKEWNEFKSNKKVGLNFTHLNVMQSLHQIQNEVGVNFQKRIRHLSKT